MSQAEYNQSQILSQLDACAADYTFAMLDNGYVYFVDARLSAYRTERYWAILIEVLGTNFRASGAFNDVYRFGNCFPQTPGLADDGIFPVLDDPVNDAVFDADDRWDVLKETGVLRVRQQAISYDVTPKALGNIGIGADEMDGGSASITELVRSLVPEHRNLLFATEEELNQRLQVDVPLILRLNEWNHPNVVEDELPSRSETFQLIADILVSGDPMLYKPTLPPNTHWRNWLESGTL